MLQETYFTNGKYDAHKSEKRRKQIREQMATRKFTPPGMNTEELLKQRDIRSSEAAHQLMLNVVRRS